MVEKDIQGELGRFLNEHYYEFENTFTFEVKLVKGKYDRFDFSKVQQHQKEGLLQAKEGYYYKDSDAILGNGEQKQRRRCDGFFIKTPDNYVAIAHWIPRKVKQVYFVRIEKYLELERDVVEVGKKSIHIPDLLEICDFVIDLFKKKIT
jgi:hypothetical protein